MTELGQRIAERRIALGLNKAALGRLVGVSDVTVMYWERGQIKEIGHKKLLRLAQVFGCTVSELLDEVKIDGDLDQIALETARKIAAVDPDSLPGGRTQALARAQCLIRDALARRK